MNPTIKACPYQEQNWLVSPFFAFTDLSFLLLLTFCSMSRFVVMIFIYSSNKKTRIFFFNSQSTMALNMSRTVDITDSSDSKVVLKNALIASIGGETVIYFLYLLSVMHSFGFYFSLPL